MIKEEDLSKIGQFAKPHGIKGEISLITDYDIPDISCDPYIVCDMDGILVPFFIESYRQKSSATTLVKFENINSEENVKLLSGKEAFLPSEMMPEEDEETATLTGYTIVDEKLGTIGRITDIDDSTFNILLIVDCKGSEVLIPAALVTAINRENKTAEVSLPEGFSDIH